MTLTPMTLRRGRRDGPPLHVSFVLLIVIKGDKHHVEIMTFGEGCHRLGRRMAGKAYEAGDLFILSLMESLQDAA